MNRSQTTFPIIPEKIPMNLKINWRSVTFYLSIPLSNLCHVKHDLLVYEHK